MLYFTMYVAFWRHIPTRVPFLSFGEGNRETIELVDSQTRLTKVTLYCYSYLHKEKKIKKNREQIKTFTNLVSFTFVSVKLSTVTDMEINFLSFGKGKNV